MTDVKKEIINAYRDVYLEYGFVSYKLLAKKRITKDRVKHHFHNLSELDKIARNMYPECFTDFNLEEVADDKTRRKVKAILKNKKRYVITTAVTGCKVDSKALKAVKKYCELKNASLLVLVCSDPAQGNKGANFIDTSLKDSLIITEDVCLNKNLFLSTIKTTAKQIDPITGLGRIGQKEGSFIYASPKQRLKVTSTSNTKMPYVMMTTGAITLPNYQTTKYLSERTSYIANNDHKMGAIVVELDGEDNFHYRQIQFDANGSFIDLGIAYNEKGTKRINPAALVLGDWHSSETCPIVEKSTFEMIDLLKPNKVILHDAFNGESINHHEEHNIVLKAQKTEGEKKQYSLKAELDFFVKDLEKFTKVVPETVVVKSNHDVFLDRYLKECNFSKNPLNLKISLELALLMVDGKDPLKEYCNSKVKEKNKIRWLSIDEDFKIAGIQCGAHGHIGSNGSRGTLQHMENAYGSSITGHSHTPAILRDAWAVGTSTPLKLGYNHGPSSWMNTHCIVYPNGMRQLVNIINGKWKLNK